MKMRLLQSDTIEGFAEVSEAAINDGYMFVGQLIITGLGQGKFMYTQQWAKGVDDEVQRDNPE